MAVGPEYNEFIAYQCLPVFRIYFKSSEWTMEACVTFPLPISPAWPWVTLFPGECFLVTLVVFQLAKALYFFLLQYLSTGVWMECSHPSPLANISVSYGLQIKATSPKRTLLGSPLPIPFSSFVLFHYITPYFSFIAHTMVCIYLFVFFNV